MKNYVKPDVFVTNFQANETIADSCNRVVTGTETTTVYEKKTVHCVIGDQTETVFNTASGCSTSSTKWGVTELNGTQYFVWFTYSGDTGSGGPPSSNATATLNTLVTQLGFSTGSGWHYCDVTSKKLVTDVLGFSY